MEHPNDNNLYPLHVFRFQVDFKEVSLDPKGKDGDEIALCSGAFSQCSGLEATMEPHVIKEGGRNYGAAQRTGPYRSGQAVVVATGTQMRISPHEAGRTTGEALRADEHLAEKSEAAQ